MRTKIRGFTILELLVVVAIIAILAIVAIPNFIGRIDDAKASQELAEINAVGKAISTYYADKGTYPTLQGKDGTLLQAQPIEGSPHNIDFSSLVPDYLASLPHFSYWWVDYQGNVYHTEKPIGTVATGVFTPVAGYTYKLYKANGTAQVLSAGYTLLAGDYVIGKDEAGKDLPKISSVFKNTKVHPESSDVLDTKPSASIGVVPSSGFTNTTSILWDFTGSKDVYGDSVASAEWKQDGVLVANPNGTLTAGSHVIELRVKDSRGLWGDWVSKSVTVIAVHTHTVGCYVNADTVNNTPNNRYPTNDGLTGPFYLSGGVVCTNVLPKVVNSDSSVYISFAHSNLTSSGAYGSLGIKLNGTWYTINQAKDAGLITYVTCAPTHTTFTPYPNLTNILSGGQTGEGVWAGAYVKFITNKDVTMTEVRILSTTSTGAGDGLSVNSKKLSCQL